MVSQNFLWIKNVNVFKDLYCSTQYRERKIVFGYIVLPVWWGHNSSITGTAYVGPSHVEGPECECQLGDRTPFPDLRDKQSSRQYATVNAQNANR